MRKRRDEEKPWLDDLEFKELVKEKEVLYSRKIRGILSVGEGERLVQVSSEVNRMRRRLKREYFDQRMGEIEGDMRAIVGLRGSRGSGALVDGYA